MQPGVSVTLLAGLTVDTSTMPWKDTGPVEERTRCIEDWLTGATGTWRDGAARTASAARGAQVDPAIHGRRLGGAGPAAEASVAAGADAPNGVWTIDHKGQFRTADGHWQYR